MDDLPKQITAFTALQLTMEEIVKLERIFGKIDESSDGTTGVLPVLLPFFSAPPLVPCGHWHPRLGQPAGTKHDPLCALWLRHCALGPM
jgi:hypothetical protein